MCITPGALDPIIGQSCLVHNKKTKESNDLLVALPQFLFFYNDDRKCHDSLKLNKN